MGELLAIVPPDGSRWPRPARQRWVAAMGAVLDVLYEDVLPGPPSRSAETTLGPDSSPFVDGPRVFRVEDEPVSRSLSATERSSSILDLRSSQAHAGKHARPGTSDG